MNGKPPVVLVGVGATSDDVFVKSKTMNSATMVCAASVDRSLFRSKINKRRFLLYGDFHTLKQSQRGLIRLLKAYSSLYRERPIILALEMFKAIADAPEQWSAVFFPIWPDLAGDAP